MLIEPVHGTAGVYTSHADAFLLRCFFSSSPKIGLPDYLFLLSNELQNAGQKREKYECPVISLKSFFYIPKDYSRLIYKIPFGSRLLN